MGDVRIEVRGLTKRFGELRAVDGLSFEVTGGTVTGFLGPNGAGKTTTLRMLLGLVTPSSGVALINSTPYRQLESPSKVVGAVLESSGCHPGRSARNHLRCIATASGVTYDRVEEVLDLVGLTSAADRKVGGYSMGMHQRLELARALLGDPQILILDEPANGLDPRGIAWLRNILRDFASQGKLVLISSHVLAEAAQTVDEVIVMSNGRLAGRGRLDDLLQGARTTVRVRVTEPERLVGALGRAGMDAHLDESGVALVEGGSAGAVGRIMAEERIVVLEMSSSGESLEELFFSLTAGAAAPGAPPGTQAPPGTAIREPAR